MLSRLRPLVTLLPVIALAAAAWALDAFLADHSFDELMASIGSVSGARVAGALTLTAASFALLVMYDVLGIVFCGGRVPLRRIAVAAPIAYAFSNSVGISMLTSGALRLRLYRDVLTNGQIAKLTVFCTLTLWLGPIALLPGAFALLGFPWETIALTAAGAAALLGAIVGARLWWRKPAMLGGVPLQAPGPRMALAQIALSAADWIVAALVLAVLVPSDVAPPDRLIAAFLAAQLLGLVSHLPGGIGVFEATVVALAGGDSLALAGPLLAYRLVYYIVPLVIAAFALMARELWERRSLLRHAGRAVGPGLRFITPTVLGAAVFAVGAVLLLSAVTPGIETRLDFLQNFLPLAVIDVSHVFSVVAGIALLFLARGLVRRHRDAFYVALMALAVGIMTSLLKGADYEEAIITAAVLALLWPARSFFHRRAAVFDLALTPVYAVAIAGTLALSVWLGFFVFRDVPYDPTLLTDGGVDNDAGRFLRALVVGGAFLFALLLIYVLNRGPRPLHGGAAQADLLAAEPLIAASPATYAQLGLLGDKAFMFDAERQGFVMYGVAGRSWIAMGDPVAPDPAVKRRLLWRYLEMCDAHDAWPVFYQAWPENLELYLDAGLAVNKMGEEALVDLKSFTLDGGKMANLRQSMRAAERKGLTFEVVPAAQTASHLDEMQRVSDAWLKSKNVREKGFSLGRFDEDYLKSFPTVLVRDAGSGALMAFANVWAGADRTELSLDLMRAAPDAPPGHMDFLFGRLLLWGKAEGYRRFNLGMAPMAGLEAHRLAPIWHRAGHYAFSRMEMFYNFQGLRQYKQKFAPVWEPRYLISPGGAPLTQILMEASALVSGGLMGVIRK